MRLRAQKHTKKKFLLPLLLIIVVSVLSGFLLGFYNLPGYLKANFVLLKNPKVLSSLYEENTLDTLYINISFENFQKILSKRKEALKIGKLFSSPKDFVRAKINFDGKEHSCKIRLKGDLPKHWTGEKISLRVELKDDSTYKGMSNFSIQDPDTRKGTDEWLFISSLGKENCMAVKYDFVNIVLNGKPMGIFAIQEHYSKEMIESNNRREGVILSFDEYLIWKKFPPNLFTNINWDTIFSSSEILVRNSKRIQKSESLLRQKETALNLLRSLQEGTTKASEIFCPIQLGKFLALTHLWNAEHALDPDDINFYYNPIISQLEPIGSDAQLGTYPHYCFFKSGIMKENWVNVALKDHSIASSYIEFLSKFSSHEYIESLGLEFAEKEKCLRNLLIKECIGMDHITIWKSIPRIFDYDPWSKVTATAKKIRQELAENNIILGYAKRDHSNKSIRINLRNTTTQPVEVISLILNDQNFSASEKYSHNSKNNKNVFFNDSFILPPRDNKNWEKPKNYSFVLAHLDKADVSSESISVICRFLGNPSPPLQIEVPIDHFSFIESDQPIKGEKKISQKMLKYLLDDNKSILFGSGLHDISSQIFIPFGYEVSIASGATLSFAKNSTFVSMSPVYAVGSSSNPIAFEAADQTWPGFFIAKTPTTSIFEHVEFRDVSGVGSGPNPQGLNLNGWTLTGGISFYRSDVSFKNCTFSNFFTEDALNIIDSSFTLNTCQFENSISDAFDGDFVNGNIQDCFFNNIAGDGVDFSGSNASIQNCKFSNIGDKAISVGESSHVSIENSKIRDVSFGIVSKDLSKVEVRGDSLISNSKIANFSAFQKKSSFGSATIQVETRFLKYSEHDFLIQDGSIGLLNGEPINSVNFDPVKLYEKQKNIAESNAD